MTEEAQRPAGYREKTLVLCSYRALVREGNSARWIPDAVMVKVEFSDQIMAAFEEKIRLLKLADPYRYLDVQFLKFMTQSGKEKF